MRRPRFFGISLGTLTAVFGCVATAAGATASPGTFDPAFGSGGSVVSPLVPGVEAGNSVEGAAVAPNGVILVLGTNGTIGGPANFVVDAFEPDGQLDTAFADGGALQGPAGSLGNSITVAPSGEIYVSAGFDNHNEIYALSSDGTADPSFGTGGVVQIEDSRSTDFPDGPGLQLQPDGKLLFTGQTLGGCCGYGFVERLNPSGTLDTTFGRDGRALLGRPGLAINPPLVQASNGDLVVAGGYPGRVIRLLPNGKHDPSFGRNGQIYLRATYITALALQHGKILVAADAGQRTGILSRFEPDGSLDRSFAQQGHVTSEAGFGHFYPTTLALQPDGAILYSDGAKVVRLKRDGATDLTYGHDGATELPRGSRDPNEFCNHDICAPPYRSSVKLEVLASGDVLEVGAIQEYDPSTDAGGIYVLLASLLGDGTD